MERSGVGAAIDTERIPAAADADIRTAACAGEDYVLLLTAECADAERLAADFLARFGAPLHPVGRITDGRELEWFENGRSAPSTGTASRITDISATADGKIAPENQQTQKPANRPDKKYSPNESATVRTGHQKPAAENRRPNKPATKPTGNRTDRPAKQTARHITSQPTFRPSTTFRPSAGRNKKTAPEQTPPHRTARHITSRQAYRPSAAISPLGSHNKKQRPEGRRISLTPGAASRHKTYSLII